MVGMPAERATWLLLISCMHAVAISAVMQAILCWAGLGNPKNMPLLSVGNALVLVFSGLAVHVQDAYDATLPFFLVDLNTWANAALARSLVWESTSWVDFHKKNSLAEWIQSSGWFGVATLGSCPGRRNPSSSACDETSVWADFLQRWTAGVRPSRNAADEDEPR